MLVPKTPSDAAIHEAGHAVFARLAKMHIDKIRLDPTPRVDVSYARFVVSIGSFLNFNLAGEIAQHLLGKGPPPGRADTTEGSDGYKSWLLLRGLGYSTPQALVEIEAARKTLEEHILDETFARPTILRLAAELDKRRTLTSADLEKFGFGVLLMPEAA